MTPEQVAASYDRIAHRWLDLSTTGFAQIERAVAFAANWGWALDVGCGAGRCLALLARQNGPHLTATAPDDGAAEGDHRVR